MSQVKKSNPNLSYLILKAIVDKVSVTDNKRNNKVNFVKEGELVNQGIMVALANIKEADISSTTYINIIRFCVPHLSVQKVPGFQENPNPREMLSSIHGIILKANFLSVDLGVNKAKFFRIVANPF